MEWARKHFHFTMILCPLFVCSRIRHRGAVLVTYVATQIGFGSSWMNPFSVGVAQELFGIDDLCWFSLWLCGLSSLGCGMTMKVKKTPTISVAYESDYFP